jgi:hypothetical protein
MPFYHSRATKKSSTFKSSIPPTPFGVNENARQCFKESISNFSKDGALS